MQCRASFIASAAVFFTSMMLLTYPVWSAEQAAAPAPEPELVIVKYGSLFIKSSEPDARVYIDESLKGSADRIIEGVVVGEHVISCRTDDKSVSGTFQVRKNETLRLEARFDEGKLVRETATADAEKKKQETVKQEKPKKTAAEAKKSEQKNPVEELRRTHFNLMRLDYEVTNAPAVKIEHAANHNIISKYNSRKGTSGKYYRTKQGVLLCDTGPCELTWTASFIYTDETNNTDALLLKWKETVFNGITPSGTSRQDLECCLNGQCSKMEKNSKIDTQEFDVGRYNVNWTGASVLIRRSDIMKEILDTGRSLADY